MVPEANQVAEGPVAGRGQPEHAEADVLDIHNWH